ncbi:PP2C family protein-serine/threonine phosphatase [Nocardioides sp. Kera G14]|uniref:PP2C family protein-serine/threonine phosphatase n=1 Tax=Nocardioides sp. Kera G14 TaxID=2884264 RepID=UPI001D13012C|nr:GAF domain-containing SpoIIE family protein phosphatase [Nocardioides sp. Kera G14]UDY25086.1 SpoIIE family protein phosphatase [Nocardioides sp. Kera G14]
MRGERPESASAAHHAAYRELVSALRGVRSGMRSDTASVLLVDSTRTLLEPAATVGLDRTLWGARVVPIGQGFAGRVAQTRQPVVLGEVNDSTVLNPVLLQHGVSSLLGVPIIDGSALLGVLHVGFLDHHDFTDGEKLRLTEYAGEMGRLLNDRFHDAQHTAALTLQRSLLPTALRVPAGLAMAARYVPADGDLGGDWYDVFELPDGRVGLVMGDVVGHGLDSAIVMGRLRSALRAYALDHDDPSEVLARLDRKICHFEPDALATVLYGVSEPPYEYWDFSSAGHFAPILAVPGEWAGTVTMTIDRLLGMSPDAVRTTTRIPLPLGAKFCLFTDGLVERRPAPEDGDADLIADGIARAAKALAAAEDPELGCIRILGEVVGEQVAEDDVAVLVAQRLN